MPKNCSIYEIFITGRNPETSTVKSEATTWLFSMLNLSISWCTLKNSIIMIITSKFTKLNKLCIYLLKLFYFTLRFFIVFTFKIFRKLGWQMKLLVYLSEHVYPCMFVIISKIPLNNNWMKKSQAHFLIYWKYNGKVT